MGTTERRKSKRFEPTEEMLSALKVKDALRPIVGEILDISVGGLTFIYEDSTFSLPGGEAKIDLFKVGEPQVWIEEIPCSVVYDQAHPESRFRGESRRCGVQFGYLTETQLSGLEALIQEGAKPLALGLLYTGE